MRSYLIATVLVPALLVASACTQELRLLLPTGASRGQHIKVTCYGRYLKDTHSVVWLRHGIEVEKIEATRDDRITLHLHVPDDCDLGAYLFQLHTLRGLSRAKAFRVGPLQSILERKDHGTRATAQRIGLNMTVDGRILAEEVDWYAFEADQGQVVRAEVEAVRLGLYDLDVEFEVFDPDGRMILRCDDSSLGKADPVACWTAEKTGTYWLSLRDIAFRGASAAAYRLHVGTFPRPIGLLPAGGRPGEVIEVKLLGDGQPATTKVQLPAHAGLHEVFVEVDGQTCPSPVRVRVDDCQCFVEGTAPEKAPKSPCAFHGVVAKAGEEDRFAFHATKGRRILIRTLARNLRSPLDPVLIIRDAKGKAITSDDDSIGLDCRLTFNPPATGTYYACVRDHRRQGSDAHFYRIEIGAGTRTIDVAESVPGRLTEIFGVAVPRGRHNATLVRAAGLSTADKATLTYENLPPGMTASRATLPANFFVPIVFSADAKADLQSGLATPVTTIAKGRPKHPTRHLHRFPVMRVDNNQIYDTQQTNAMPVVITDPVPFDFKVVQPKVPIVRSGSLALPVALTRAKTFTGTVTVRTLILPAGVSASTVRFTGKNVTGTMTFNANSRASLGSWPLVLVASSSIGGVTRTISTEILTLTVEEPWVTASVPKTKLERGATGTFELALTHTRKFEGKITAKLVRVPKGVTCTVPEVTKGMAKLPIKLEIAKDAPVGRHRYIYVQLKIQTKDGLITHNVGSGEIRIDKPIPAEPKPKASKPATGKPTASKTKGQP